MRPWHPVFEADGFESASIDKFWLAVPVPDAAGARERLELEARSLGARRSTLIDSEGAR